MHEAPSAIGEGTVERYLIQSRPIANRPMFVRALYGGRRINQRRRQPQEFAGRDLRSKCATKLCKHLTHFY